jgi:hypothetical protein
MSYPDACRAMTTAISEREDAIDALSLAYYHGKGAVTIHRHLMAVLDSHHRFQQARAEVLGMTIPQGMEKETAS